MYRKAPLPFTGQKRNFLKLFKQVLDEHIPGDGEDWTILDAFGGSGLLSHTAKQSKPAARVIYNDYDGYSARLQRIPDINRLRHLLAGLLAPVPRSKLVPPVIKAAIVAAIRSFGGYIDLDCLVSWLLFSGNTAADLDELCRKTMYNCISLSDYPEAQDYLQGVEIVGQSYRELLPQHIGNPRTLLVLDPPYVCTQQGNYRKAAYFGMVEFLRLMAMVRPPFVFFSSTRSELPAYLDLVAELRLPGWERFAGSQTLTVSSTINRNSSYDDHLIYKF